MFYKCVFIRCFVALFYLIADCASLQTLNTENNGWYGSGCPPHATGQFPYLGDCKRFYNCYNGRGQLSICAPGTLFNPSTLECDFPSKVTCLKNDEKNGNVDRSAQRTGHYHHHHHHQHPHNGWQYQGQPQSNPYYQPVEKSAKSYAGVQPPSFRMEPPPVYYQNPQYGIPSIPAQPVSYPRPYYPDRFDQQPPNNPYSPDLYSSRAHNAPPAPVPNFNSYQPVQPKQVYHTKTYTPSEPTNWKAEPKQPTYAEPPLPSYPQGSPQGKSGYNGFVFPDHINSQRNVNPGYNQGYYGQNYPSALEPKPAVPAISYPPLVPPALQPQINYSYPSNPGAYPPNSAFQPELYSTTTEVYDAPKDVCPEGFSGLTAHSDCTKFLSCSHGRTFVMDCSPGTRFNPDLLICDHIHAVKCDGNHKKNVFTEEDNLQPAETNREINIYRAAEPPHESLDPEQTAIIDAIENITDSLINYDKTKVTTSTVSTTTESPITTEKIVQTLSIIPRIRIESSPKGNIIINDKKNETTPKQSFKPEIPSAPKGRLISKRNSTLDKQIIRLRGSPSQFEGFVEMQLSTGSWGVVCDKRNDWKIEEAHVVCKSLGYPRGAELSWQGLPADVKNITSNILATDVVICTGSEDSLLDCALSVGDGCDPAKDGIWVRCYSHGLSRCYPGEMSLGDRCYSIVVPTEETTTENLVGFSQGEALAYCQKKGGHLVDITSQVENDFVSEWLIRQDIDGNIMTSGVGMSLMGGSIWIWEGSESTFTYHNWWPGWGSAKSIPPQTYTNRALCIILRRYFPCKNSKGTEERLCDAQYYYWDVEDCDAMPTSLPYVCERPANKIGCVMGTGAGYKGAANVTKAGNICLSWDHKDVLQELKYRISEADRKVSLSGHNYCRNIAGKESHPWCYVRETSTLVKKELCDIPICSEGVEKSARYFQCPPNYFACGISGKCIPMSQVCDGQSDCSNSEDESNCQPISAKFSTFENSKLIVSDVEVFIRTPLNACAQRCLELANCRSFSFLVDQEECVLSESNIGLSGNRSHAPGWNYYEVKSKSILCKNSFVCDNGKCIAQETVCNGRDDCGDRSDERNCSWLKQKIQIKLNGGAKPNEGTIEVKAHDKWGLICDDEFELKDGDVVCRHLGYPLGAAEIKKHSSFNTDHTMTFIIDNLNCFGNETSIADCFHNGWGIHDCQAEECLKAAGVVCKVAKSECSFNYWQCEKSAECIPLAFLCDNVKDCKDHSDEDPKRCESPIEVRLVGTGGISRSNKANEGRVEVRRFGVWGTVCDDDFGAKEAKVVCGALGYNGSAQVYKEAAYGAGEGIIWLDQVHCLGNESNIHQCLSDGWGQTNCKHNEDVAVSCLQYTSNEGVLIKPNSKDKIFQENEIELGAGDVLLEDIFIADCGTVLDMFGSVKHDAIAKVVAGFETVKGTYPWQASIRLKGITGKSTHWCGAVVVSRFHIITAGHCLRDYAKSAYFIRAGDYDNEVDEGTEQDMEIDEMWIHSGFDKGTKLNNDIALVKIKGEGFEFNTWVLPACLPQNNPPIPENCTISGWGSSANPGTGFARTLHATWLKPISYQQCKSIDAYNNSLSVGMMCAGNLEGGPDSCQGDSGGPLLCPVNGQFTLFGITSWGHGCGRSNSPGVYTNVLHYVNWINDRIKISMKKQKYRKN